MLYLPRNKEWVFKCIQRDHYDALVAAERRYQDEMRAIHEECAKQWAKVLEEELDGQLNNSSRR